MATLTGKRVKDTYKDLLQVSNSNSGIDATMRVVSDGEATDSVLYLSSAGVAVSSGLNIGAATAVASGKVTQTAVLNAASGAEVAYALGYTVNKAAGDDTGLQITMTDSASPGTSYLLNAIVGSTSLLSLSNAGVVTLAGSIAATKTITAADADGTRHFSFTATSNTDPAASAEVNGGYFAFNKTAGSNGTYIYNALEGVYRSQYADESSTGRGVYGRFYIDPASSATLRTGIGIEASARASYSGGTEIAAESGTAFVGSRIWMAPYFSAATVGNVNNFWGLWIYGEHASQRNADAAIKISDANGGWGELINATNTTGPGFTFTSNLNNASGNEIAYTLNYTTNKVAGNDTGLLISMTDTLSPGTSLPLDIQVGAASKFYVDNGGVTTAVGSIKVLSDSNQFLLGASSDVGLVRSAAGILKVSNGSTSYGALNIATIQADPQTTDAASQALTIMGGDAFAGAATNVTGGALNLSGGIGKRLYTIVDYTALAAATVTVTVNGSATIKTEGGGDWTAATSNNDTATSLASAIDAISGVSATASGATVRIVPDVTTYSIKLAKSAADAAMTQTVGADGGVVGNRLLHAATGNEIAYTLNYETAKATSGDDTGLLISMTDTTSPGTSLLIDAQVGAASKFKVDSAGAITVPVVAESVAGALPAKSLIAGTGSSGISLTNGGLALSYGNASYGIYYTGDYWKLSNYHTIAWHADNAIFAGGSTGDTHLTRAGVGILKILAPLASTHGALELDTNAHYYADTVTLTDNVLTALFDVALVDTAMVGGTFHYTIKCVDATPHYQVEQGTVNFMAFNKAAAYTTDFNVASSQILGSGTLATTFSITTGTNLITMNVTSNSSLTPATFTLTYQLFLNHSGAVTKKT